MKSVSWSFFLPICSFIYSSPSFKELDFVRICSRTSDLSRVVPIFCCLLLSSLAWCVYNFIALLMGSFFLSLGASIKAPQARNLKRLISYEFVHCNLQIVTSCKMIFNKTFFGFFRSDTRVTVAVLTFLEIQVWQSELISGCSHVETVRTITTSLGRGIQPIFQYR